MAQLFLEKLPFLTVYQGAPDSAQPAALLLLGRGPSVGPSSAQQKGNPAAAAAQAGFSSGRMCGPGVSW